jgi:molybdopterin-guanine dinucleotide biosynthesis protein A
MGTDKANLTHPVSGLKLLEHQLTLLNRLQPPPSDRWVSCRPAQIANLLLPASVTPVLDDGKLGPLGGLVASATAARQAGATHLLVLAVDLPEMDADTLQQLLAACGPGRGAVAQTEAGWEPLVAVYPAEVFDALILALKENRLGLQRLFTNNTFRSHFASISFENEQVFTNWNYPRIPGKNPR